MPKGSELGLQTQLDNPEQDQWTIQPAGSHHVTGHVATVQTDEAVNNDDTSKCDFAAALSLVGARRLALPTGWNCLV